LDEGVVGCVGIMGQIHGLIEELDVWFPNKLVMDIMRIVDPHIEYM
jgi:hypothetical protein